MRQITFTVPDRDYKIVEKYAFLLDLTIEELCWRAARNNCSSELDWRLYRLLGFEDGTDLFEIWSPDVEEIMKGEEDAL